MALVPALLLSSTSSTNTLIHTPIPWLTIIIAPHPPLQYPLSDYDDELEALGAMTREAVVSELRRGSSGFSRGVSRFRGVWMCVGEEERDASVWGPWLGFGSLVRSVGGGTATGPPEGGGCVCHYLPSLGSP